MNNILSTKRLIMLSMLIAIIIIILVVIKDNIVKQNTYIKESEVQYNVYKLEQSIINTHIDKPKIATNNTIRNNILDNYKITNDNIVVNNITVDNDFKNNHYIYISSVEGELNNISKITEYTIHNKEINIELELQCLQIYSSVYDYIYEVEVPNYIDNSYKIKIDKIEKENISICEIN